jgi:hypothetical protein
MKRNNKLIVLGVLPGLAVLLLGGIAIVGPNKTTDSVTAAGATTAPATTAVAASPTSTGSSQPNFRAAGAVLLADDDHYRQVMASGPPVLGTRAFAAWWQKASTDVQWHDDLAKAQAYFTAENEPVDLIEAWRNDSGKAVTDVYEFAAVELAAGPGRTTAEMRRLEVAFQADIAKADADARNLQAMG